ncbi:MAG: hypothetical protein IT449_04835 [Phycisphaerales bacterium]|nr:hypothetical protein [Phycisphaerales bacterium]
MMLETKCPLPVATADAGVRIVQRRNPTSTFRTCKRVGIYDSQPVAPESADRDRDFFDELAVELVSETVRVEARLVCCGLHDPERLLDAGAAVDLRADDFAEPLLGCCYAALWVAVSYPGRANIVAGVEAAARAWGLAVPDFGVRNFLRWRLLGLEPDAVNTERYAGLVKRAARRRQRYARLWRGLIGHVQTERDRLAAACGDTASLPKPRIVLRRARRVG